MKKGRTVGSKVQTGALEDRLPPKRKPRTSTPHNDDPTPEAVQRPEPQPDILALIESVEAQVPQNDNPAREAAAATATAVTGEAAEVTNEVAEAPQTAPVEADVAAVPQTGETAGAVTAPDADAMQGQLSCIISMFRKELSDLGRAQHLAKAKDLYEKLHPMTRHGGAPGRVGGGKAKETHPASFVTYMAKQTRLSKTTIAKLVRIGSNLSEATMGRLVGSELANRSGILDDLAHADHEQQAEFVKGFLDNHLERESLAKLKELVGVKKTKPDEKSRSTAAQGDEASLSVAPSDENGPGWFDVPREGPPRSFNVGSFTVRVKIGKDTPYGVKVWLAVS